MLLVLSTVDSLSSGILYMAVFGIGSIIGMIAANAVISLPFIITGNMHKMHQYLGVSCGVASILFGVFYTIGLFV